MCDDVNEIITFGRGIFRVATRILVETCSVGEERIGWPAVGNESLKDVPKNFFDGKIDTTAGRKREAVFALEAENSFDHGETLPPVWPSVQNTPLSHNVQLEEVAAN